MLYDPVQAKQALLDELERLRKQVEDGEVVSVCGLSEFSNGGYQTWECGELPDRRKLIGSFFVLLLDMQR